MMPLALLLMSAIAVAGTRGECDPMTRWCADVSALAAVAAACIDLWQRL